MRRKISDPAQGADNLDALDLVIAGVSYYWRVTAAGSCRLRRRISLQKGDRHRTELLPCARRVAASYTSSPLLFGWNWKKTILPIA